MKEGEEEVRDCTKEEESWLPERAARDAARRAKMILLSMVLLALVGEVMSARLRDEAEGAMAPSDFLWGLLRPTGAATGVPWEEVVGGAPWISRGGAFQRASALSTTVLDPSATMVETKAEALSNQLPPSAAGGGGAVSWSNFVGAGV